MVVSLLELFLEAGNLKRLPRTGWLLRGVPVPESIADHSFRTALMVLFLADELKAKGVEINTEKAIRMAILHDLAETRITDVPLTAQRYLDKGKGEREAFMEMLSSVGRRDLLSLFGEYENETSIEGRLVKFADRLEMLIQAYEYEKAGFGDLDEFWGAVEKLRENELYMHFKDLLDGLVELRKQKRLR
ncbi:HD domain-containing protein [Thermococcus pacificus]|uniref:5'-deoxynucleotidase n=1 Tax=Thermococcus pacificus TaxID=71998 RepID=A0A218P9Z6_9EURY|nr:HD family hydrolase [Thermococcus pacificus]ASJ07592.1 oxetanocin [Thermococcus pacificus]